MRFEGNAHGILREAVQLGELDHFEIIHPTLHDIFVRIAQPDLDQDEKGENGHA